jgi:hypothetical protein
MRLLAIGLAAIVLTGCGSGFKDEVEEYRYLRSLSNPTPEQWRRMRWLADQPADRPPPLGGETIRQRVLHQDQIDLQRGGR